MAASNQELLTHTIQELIGKSEKAHHQFASGLLLAYNPNPAPNVYRLVLSRPKEFPTDLELETTRGTLIQILQKLRRPFANLITEPYLCNHKYKYHIIEWQEYQQLQLIKENPHAHQQSRYIYE